MTIDTAAELAAHAQIRNLIGRHTQAQDAGLTDELVGLYTEDGVLELPETDPVVGRQALHAAFTAWEPTAPQLHLVTNTVVTSVTEHEATAESDVAFSQRGEAGWAILIVGHYSDTFRLEHGEFRISRRATKYQS